MPIRAVECSCDCLACVHGVHAKCQAGGCSLGAGALPRGHGASDRPVNAAKWPVLYQVTDGAGDTLLITQSPETGSVGITIHRGERDRERRSVLLDLSVAQGMAYGLAGKLEVRL